MPIRKPKSFDDIQLEFIDYRAYFEQIRQQFDAIVTAQQTDGKKNEPVIQDFIEKHPFAITGVLGDLPAGGKIAGNCLISQPRLKSHPGDRQPDFLLITTNSQQQYFNFIEIESPAKKIFQLTKGERALTADFTKALNQLREWKIFEEVNLKSYCKDLIKTVFWDNPDMTNPKKTWHYTFTLIYGDSRELEKKNDLGYNKFLQTHFTDANMFYITYSRLIRNMTIKPPIMSIKRSMKINQFVALGMLPWKNYGLDEWQNYHRISGKEKVVRNADLLSDAEKDALIAKMMEVDKMTLQEIYQREDLTGFGLFNREDLLGF